LSAGWAVIVLTGAMPTSLTAEQHRAALRSYGARLHEHAVRVGVEALVPTCPTWDVAALLAHQTMVHRWATAQLLGEDADALPAQTELRDTVADLPGYYLAGLDRLVNTLSSVADDVSAMVFLEDPPPTARAFWTRRQAHETAIHCMDALAASLGRPPVGAESGLDAAFCADGVDEILCGFFTRGKSKLYDGRVRRFDVRVDDMGARFAVTVDEQLRTEPGASFDGGAEMVLSGAAADVYLFLWNRGGDVSIVGDSDLAERWRTTQRVRWS
jgi:uncharacterized protein (TIGR03083 family)